MQTTHYHLHDFFMMMMQYLQPNHKTLYSYDKKQTITSPYLY